ncbi:hypothetical protein [Rhizobium azibense]|uniref:hypothetical protein n=1 Tax=Rhizobium azibense TaxID=1136135 RepID=UPI001050F9C7|nr:hypothetical protein [Rhizobium azibense]
MAEAVERFIQRWQSETTAKTPAFKGGGGWVIRFWQNLITVGSSEGSYKVADTYKGGVMSEEGFIKHVRRARLGEDEADERSK